MYKRSEVIEVEEISDSEDYVPPSCTDTRQRRGTRNTVANEPNKLDSDKLDKYLKNLWGSFPEDKKSLLTYIDPLWYNMYHSEDSKEKVLNWIKNKDILSRKYVFIPIVKWGHWSLLIFCHLGESLGSKFTTPCILFLDSLVKIGHAVQLEPAIRKFVSEIYRTFGRMEDIRLLRRIPFLVPKVPQQRDGDECGFLVLYYIKLFVENAPDNFSISDGYPYFMKKDWFSFEGLDEFRKTLDSSNE